MQDQAVIDDILARLEPDTRNCRVHAISLLADAATVQARLQKDIEGGVRTADVVARSLARLPCYRQLNTRKIDTAGRTPGAVAAQIARL